MLDITKRILKGNITIKPMSKRYNNEEENYCKKKRKYFRVCGICGEKYQQSAMIRDNRSDTGWVCRDCFNDGADYFDGFWDKYY